ncbi:hypothetical protein LTR53_016306 [Teratosphaeriaceae sp. CCFEE 6253]|nr:hypothetical protein LTR53_016306 [Teratosphaeriaceae sp. CCFEE 6253]
MPTALLPPQYHLEPSDFTTAIEAFDEAWNTLDAGLESDWVAVTVLPSHHGPPYLRIKRQVSRGGSTSAATNASGEEVADGSEFAPPCPLPKSSSSISGASDDDGDDGDNGDDDAELVCPRTPQAPPPLPMTFDVVYSPSYRVPVLYLTLPSHYGAPAKYDPVTASYRQMSQTDHPITGLRTSFVHPCRTAEAMAEMTGLEGGAGAGAGVTPGEYLLMWLGVVWGEGMAVPVRLAQALAPSPGGGVEVS